jgi:hypothetical protein
MGRPDIRINKRPASHIGNRKPAILVQLKPIEILL